MLGLNAHELKDANVNKRQLQRLIKMPKPTQLYTFNKGEREEGAGYVFTLKELDFNDFNERGELSVNCDSFYLKKDDILFFSYWDFRRFLLKNNLTKALFIRVDGYGIFRGFNPLTGQ